MSTESPSRSGRIAARPVVGVIARRRTYHHLILLFLLFPIGVANVTVLVTGFALGFALVPFLVGIPILGGVLVAGTYLGAFYGRIVEALSDVSIDCEAFTFGEEGFWGGLKVVATSPRPYLLVGCLFATFPLGIATFTGLVVWIALSVSFVLAPVLGPLPGTEYRFAEVLVLDTPIEWVATSVVGLLVLFAGLWVVTLAGSGLARVAKLVLEFDGGSEIPPDRGSTAATGGEATDAGDGQTAAGGDDETVGGDAQNR